MRVVGGVWKGRAIDAPGGRGTRPTTDRVRESIASSVLSSFDLSLAGVRVLDAFAGSGALGIEMLSRGAASCTFVDEDRRAARVIGKNLASLGADPASYRIMCCDALKAAGSLAAQGIRFDLVLLDPPYAMPAEDASRLAELLCSSGCVTMEGVVVYERAAQGAPLDCPGLALVRTKDLGETAVDYYRMGAAHGA